MKRWNAIVLTLIALAACTQVHTAHRTNSGGETLRVGSAIAPNSFNPLLPTESVENMLDQLVFDKLVKVDSRGNLVPDLAVVVPSQQNGGISKDGLSVTYHLRRGVQWQDGKPFTSGDVKFSFEQVMNPRNNISSHVGYDDVRRVDTPNTYTIVFHLKARYGPIVDTLFSSNVSPEDVVPEHLLRGNADLNNVPFNSAPVGTGPYRMTKWIRDDHIEFEANPHYFFGKPHIKNIFVYLIPQENTAINELRTHELAWFYNGSEASYDQLKNISAIRTVVSDQNSYRGMLFNTESPLVSDVRVRQAIAYAIDKKSIVNKVTYGAIQAATEDLPSFMWAYNPKVQTYEYAPQKSRALLAQAGWKPGPDGILQKNGRQMELRFVLRQGAVADTEMSIIIQSQLREVGIATSIKTFLGSMLFLNGRTGILAGGHYDIDLSGFASGIDPDNSAQFICSARPPNGYNWSRYCNAEMDAAQRQALGSYDRTVRRAAYARVESLLARDVPQIFMYWAPEIDAVNPDLRGFTGGPFEPDWNVSEWSW
ncbi:MAG: peptide ABC transporter substrate-binding protein [Candidatus Baltobacteraceae bacterium]